jgi:hypothetical protein
MYDRGPAFDGELDKALAFVTGEAASRNKLTALSETGERKGMKDWWSAVILPIVSKYRVGYVLTWRDAFRTKFSVSGNPIGAFTDDFRNFYSSPRTLFLKEIQEEDIYKRK